LITRDTDVLELKVIHRRELRQIALMLPMAKMTHPD
jgi:hypothetical protein